MSSWKNPPERIMSILNLALQSVGLMRKEASEECEKKLNSASGLGQIRELAKDPVMEEQLRDSMEPVKILLTGLFSQLRLKDRQFKTFPAASTANIEAMMDCLSKFGDEPLDCRQNAQQLNKELKKRPNLQNFIEHCTVARTYFFCIKKCGADDCQMCEKPLLPPDVFETLHVLPDPEPGEEGHYKPFEEVYGTNTTEKYLPSTAQKQQTGHQMPFSPSAQTARTIKMLVYCVECDKPRVIYSLLKVSDPDKNLLERLLKLLHYSCGGSLQDLKSPYDSQENDILDKAFVRANITCNSPIEIPYFSSGCFADICYACGTNMDIEKVEGQYSSCVNCRKTVAIKRKRNVWNEKNSKKQKKK